MYLVIMNRKSTVILVVCIIVAITIYLLFPLDDEEQSKITSAIPKKEVVAPVVKNDFRFPDSTTNQIVRRPYFTLSYNEEHEQADWVAYTLYPNNTDTAVVRKNRFKPDPLVKTLSASLKDYSGSGYDRGHLAPSKALSFSQEANDASFFMSNMSPQNKNFNRGIWKKIEAKVYDWSNQSDSLYVVTGPVFSTIIDTIGPNKVSVPGAYYKVLLRFKNTDTTGIAFLIENKRSSKSVEDFLTSIDSVEIVTGIDFYHQLDSVQQARVEVNRALTNFIK